MAEESTTGIEIVSDAALIEKVSVRDRRAFALLYDRMAPRLYGLAITIVKDRDLAGDVIQDVFSNVWNKAGTFRSVRGTVFAWMATMCRNRCIDLLRSQRLRNQRFRSFDPTNAAEYQDQSAADPATRTHQRLLQESVRAAMGKLSPEQRDVLDLAYRGGLTQSEIAGELSLPLGTVKSRMRLGLQRLRSLLQNQLDREAVDS